MHITKYSRRQGQEHPDRPGPNGHIGEVEIALIADAVAARLKSSVSKPPNAEEIARHVREGLLDFQAQMADLLHRAIEPKPLALGAEAPGPPPETEVIVQELARQHEQLTAKLYALFAGELAALASKLGGPPAAPVEARKLSPEENELIISGLAGRVQPMLDEDIEKLRQPLAAIASAIKGQDAESTATLVEQKVRALLDARPAEPVDAPGALREELARWQEDIGRRLAQAHAPAVDLEPLSRAVAERLERAIASQPAPDYGRIAEALVPHVRDAVVSALEREREALVARLSECLAGVLRDQPAPPEPARVAEAVVPHVREELARLSEALTGVLREELARLPVPPEPASVAEAVAPHVREELARALGAERERLTEALREELARRPAPPSEPPKPEKILRRLCLRLDVDPNDAAAQDDRFVLRSTDGSYRCEKTLKDDQKPGDAFVDLLFTDVDGALNYTLEIFASPTAEAQAVFENKPFHEIAGLSLRD